jgi:two-component system, chemotaxis family, chemotaxis protein CheY
MNRKRVLVVDDSYYMRTVLKDILSDAGFNVVGEASDSVSALRLAKDVAPDLVTLDLVLLDNSGLDTLKYIKKAHPEMKVIVVSATGQPEMQNKAADCGANAYIVKPFEREQVLQVLSKVTHN